MKRLNRPYRVGEPIVRGVALQVLILSLIGLFTNSVVPVIALSVDFAIRALLIPRISPLAFFSRKIIVPIAGFRNRQVVFKPKRFAALIGLILSASAIPALLSNSFPALVLLGLLSFFSFLEAFFSFCAGCKIFGFLIRLGLVKEDECPDCVYTNGSGI